MSTNGKKPRCMYLTCKSMMVYGEDFENDPDFQSGQVEFTCSCTFTNQGPDGELVALNPCSESGRRCFREY
jgi:hypothetical protein